MKFFISEVGPDGEPLFDYVNNETEFISSGTFPLLNLPYSTPTTFWAKVDMSEATLQPGTMYALCVYDGNISNTKWRADGTSPSYTGGNAWTWSDSTEIWTKDITRDLMFQINGGDYEGVLCTLGEAISKAGANAPANSKSPLLASLLVKQAESTICVQTTTNWIDDYSSLNEDVKYILNKVCSAMAAIDIIAYDLDNYAGGRVEAETMINVHRETVAELIKDLSSEDKQNFITTESP